MGARAGAAGAAGGLNPEKGEDLAGVLNPTKPLCGAGEGEGLAGGLHQTDPETGEKISASTYYGVPDYYGKSTSWIEIKIAGVIVIKSFKKTWKGTGARVKTITDLKKRMQEGIEIYHAPSEKRRYKFRVNEEGVIERSILKEEVGESESREVL